jgi:hypothetical protein
MPFLCVSVYVSCAADDGAAESEKSYYKFRFHLLIDVARDGSLER